MNHLKQERKSLKSIDIRSMFKFKSGYKVIFLKNIHGFTLKNFWRLDSKKARIIGLFMLVI